MGKFRQKSLELLPLMYVENLFPCSILGIFGRFYSNFVFKIDTEQEWFRNVCGGISSNKHSYCH